MSRPDISPLSFGEDGAGRIGRRDALKIMGATAALASVPGVLSAEEPADGAKRTKRPNIVYLFTDQQHAGMMSCVGDPYLKTPAMDSLARTGARFERAYCANPVCVPSRFSMMTGRMPSVVGMKSNAGPTKPIADAIPRQAMGWVFRNAGYETAYGGKVHLPKGMDLPTIGFDCVSRDQRAGLGDACTDFIKMKREKPFLLVASFVNPHDICYMAINDYEEKQGKQPQGGEAWQCLQKALQLPDGVSREEFFAKHCPPVPVNYELPALEPEAITTKIMQGRRFKEYARKTWPDEKWRLHRWAYCRLTEMVDAHVGKVLQAIHDAGLAENTLIVFSSDHGDMDAAHRMEHKTVLYEEATRVPFIVSFQGVTKPSLVDGAHLISNGLDLIPTLCDYAGIDPPKGLLGRSVRALAEGRRMESWRDHLVVESEFGRMLRTDRYKYNVYESGQRREQLTDLERDPGEMTNLAEDPNHREILETHRRRLRQWVEETDDEIASPYVIG